MWRQPLVALLALCSAFPAAAAVPETLYDGNDAEKETRFRRLFTPWELALFAESSEEALRNEAPLRGHDDAKREQVRAAAARMLTALDGASPDEAAALRELETIRTTLLRPVSAAYIAVNAAAGAPLTPFESALFNGMFQDWLPNADRLALQSRTPAAADVRLVLRGEAGRYATLRPNGRIDRVSELGLVQMNLRIPYGTTAPAGPGGAPGAGADRLTVLRTAAPALSDAERLLLSVALTDAAMTAVAAGRSTLDLRSEAIDAANLAVADQSDPEVVATLARKSSIFKPGLSAALRAAVPAADLSNFVCQNAARVPGRRPGSGALAEAQAALATSGGAPQAKTPEAAAAEADIVTIDTVGYPGVAQYCLDTAGQRSAAGGAAPVNANLTGGPSQAGLRTAPVPDSQTGRGTGRALAGQGRTLGGILPFMAGAAIGGLIAAAIIGAGPFGLLAGLFLGAAAGGALGLLFGKR